MICRECKEDCAHCATEALCLKCKVGYYRDTTDAACLTCPDECSACDSKELCSACAEGYYSSPGTGIGCSKCALDACENCVDENTCEKCIDGFYLSNGNCVKNPDISGTAEDDAEAAN
jgi:hypothetical protein